MNRNDFLARTPLFAEVDPADIGAMLACLGMSERRYARGSYIHRMGDKIATVGIVTEGRTRIENVDAWGNVSIMGLRGPGEMFGEVYAAMPGEPLLVDVVADDDCAVLFLNVGKMAVSCPERCPRHGQVARNLTVSLARQSLAFSRRLFHVAPKTIRGKLLAYLSDVAERTGSQEFDIPLNRQQLADYLGVDRSALSAELSRMRAAGLIECRRSHFKLLA